MSMGGRVMVGGEACQILPLACIPPPQPPLLCLGQLPTPHTTWSTTSTFGSPHPHFPSAHSSVRVARAPTVGVVHKEKPAGTFPPAQCPTVPLPQLSRASFHVGYYVPPSVEPGDPYGGLEQVWNHHFELIFRNLPNIWTFGPTEVIPVHWSVFKDMAKVRFSCQRCSHGWTSMYGLVVFYYKWDTSSNQGNVRFLLTGQKCNQCDPPGFETPMWYPEEAQKVASRIYGLQTPPLIRDRRHGRPRHQHNSSMCEGCHQGLCKTPRTTAL
ncbi:receptor-transporting protein 3 isoform X2 [Procambarus clarkii]|uniref:receptor-transporting protein 3 isoform X2 n=1 Tax=Procambarus clarkii TaxID=6728 RepID=UPI003741F258